MSKYYYLVAGLPELTLEDSKLSYTVADFKSELYSALSEEDRRLIDLFLSSVRQCECLEIIERQRTLRLIRGETTRRKN